MTTAADMLRPEYSLMKYGYLKLDTELMEEYAEQQAVAFRDATDRLNPKNMKLKDVIRANPKITSVELYKKFLNNEI